MLFGAATPLGKLLVARAGPVALASVFYLSAGAALALVAPARPHVKDAPLRLPDVPVLVAVAVLGGVVGPVLMLFGLSRVSGVSGSLLLNLEAPATMVLATAVFGEHLGRREALAAAIIVGGAALLALEPVRTDASDSAIGALALLGASVAWGIDNNLTQRLSLRDPIALVRWKALAAGTGNLALALAFGSAFPGKGALVGAIVVGALGYGASIALDAYALRLVGAAREAAYFATAPFFGALLAVPVLRERLAPMQLAGGMAIAWGTWRLLRERHAHAHLHPTLTHEHLHQHDSHHQHDHPPETAPGEPHAHVHTHAPLSHAHAHVSDAHHRHRH